MEAFKKELSDVPTKKEGFKAVNKHLDTAILESEEAAKKIIDIIGSSLEDLNKLSSLVSNCGKSPEASKIVNSLVNNLTNALTLLEFQDIIAQRLIKVKGFLSDVEKSIVKIALLAGIEDGKVEERGELQKKLEELEWKKEVSQKDVDEIMKQFGM